MEIKKGYEKPELVDLGTLAELTEGFTAVTADNATTGVASTG